MDERDPPRPKQVPDMNFIASPSGVSNPAQPPGSAVLEPDLQRHIGRHLRALYDEVVNEAVPDRFLQLLEELERKEAQSS